MNRDVDEHPGDKKRSALMTGDLSKNRIELGGSSTLSPMASEDKSRKEELEDEKQGPVMKKQRAKGNPEGGTSRTKIRLEDVEEYEQKSRAMRRIYSQRNRDKLKRQIQELEEMKEWLETDQNELLETRKSYKRRIADIEEENESLRQQLIEQKRRDVMILEHKNKAQMQLLQAEMCEVEGRNMVEQKMAAAHSISTGMMGGAMMGGADMGRMGDRLGNIWMGIGSSGEAGPTHFIDKQADMMKPACSGNVPQHLTILGLPPHSFVPGIAALSAVQNPYNAHSAMHGCKNGSKGPQVPVYCPDSATMQAIRQRMMAREEHRLTTSKKKPRK